MEDLDPTEGLGQMVYPLTKDQGKVMEGQQEATSEEDLDHQVTLLEVDQMVPSMLDDHQTHSEDGPPPLELSLHDRMASAVRDLEVVMTEEEAQETEAAPMVSDLDDLWAEARGRVEDPDSR